MTPDRARLVLGLLDLTSLNADDDETRIRRLCAKATSAETPVAAICIWPRFVKQARSQLEGSGIRVAAVANFPHGSTLKAAAEREAAGIVADGGHEVDLVFPYNAWLNGARGPALDLVGGVRRVCGSAKLKVILETGCLRDPATIAEIADALIANGADFIKTSTGKTAISATLEAAYVMLEAIKRADRPCGFKAAGGIRDAATADLYLDLAEKIMGPNWPSPATFRFGASGLMDSLNAVISGAAPAQGRGTY